MVIFALRSKEGKVIELDGEFANHSKVLLDLSKEKQRMFYTEVVHYDLPDISCEAVEKIVLWCSHHAAHRPFSSRKNRQSSLPYWDKMLLDGLTMGVLMDIAVATSRLEITLFWDSTCKMIASSCKDMTPADFRALFGIPGPSNT